MADVEEIRVLIASPADVQEERDLVEKIIEQVNRIVTALEPPIRLRLIRWETAVQPAIGGDPQAIVNSQVPAEYEVFIGILWTHFGTPTPRSDSGTLEEFEAAVARHKEDPSSVSVMFYFKNAPRAPMDIDPKQLQKVQEFREKYKKDGIYGTFTNTENFKDTLHMHLMRLAIVWRREKKQGATHISNPVVTDDEAEDDPGESRIDPPHTQGLDDDQGFLDLIEEGVQGFNEGTAVLRRLEKYIRELGVKMELTTGNLTDAQNEIGGISPSGAKKIINSMAADIARIATGIQAEVVPFKNTFGTGIRAYGRAANLLSDFSGDITAEIKDSISSSSTLEQAIGEAREELHSLKANLERTPRVTSKYNKARRKLIEVLDELDREMSAASTSAQQTVRFFEELHEVS